MDYRIILYASLFLVIVSCGYVQENKRQPGKRLNIVTTTGMIADAIKNIVKDSAEVQALMGPGVDPHLYKATQGDLNRLTQADAIFYNGLHLEGKMGEVFNKLSRRKPVIACAGNIEPSRLRRTPAFNNNFDPHVWFDVSLWILAVKEMNRALGEIDSTNANFYNRNTQAYIHELKELDNWVRTKIVTIPKNQRILITAHDAFGYFGDAYDIDVKGLQGISTLSEYGLRDVSDLVNYIVSNKIKAVFVETSVSKRAINAVVEGCRHSGFDVQIGGNLFSDAMGEEGTPEGTYIGMVKANVNTIVKALI